MSKMKNTKFSYKSRIGKLLTAILVSILWITSFPSWTNHQAFAENTGIGLSGSNPNRRFYESKVLDKPSQNERGGYFGKAHDPDDSLAGPGRMYPYSDVDPRQDTMRASRKANELVKDAERNVVERSQDSKTVAREVRQKRSAEADKIKDKIKDTPEALGDRAKFNLSQLKDEVDRGSKNLRENAKDTAESIPRVVKQGTENFKGKLEETADDLSDIGDSAKRVAGRAKEASQDAAQNAKGKAVNTFSQHSQKYYK